MRLARFAASACALALATAGTVGVLAPTSSAAATNAYSVAPYVDMSNGQEGMLDTAITGHGLKAYTAAFVLGEGCTQIWGDTLPIGADSYTDPEIARAKAEGASVIISSGGASGEPLAWTCSTQSSIDAGYQAIISDYGVTQLDFDIEGAAIADTAAAARQMQAMKDLKASNPGLQFSMTLPVLTSGLTNDGVNILRAAKNAGIRIDVVNIMTMDYYAGTGTEMGQGAVSAAQATLAQMQSVDSGYTYANLGITPMIGKNDDGSTFTLADAQTVESFAAQHGIQELSFWALGRDKACATSGTLSDTCSGTPQSGYQFSSTFNRITGSTGGGGGTAPTGRITGYGGKCVDVAAASTANGTAVQLYDCNGTAAQNWTVATDGSLQALGKCMDVTSAGTANGTKVQLYDCNGTGSQVWRKQSDGSLVNPQSGRCLDATGPSSANGTRLQIWDCTGGANQKWTLPA
ncbi:chitinase [Streptacidiphilus griseoplanus]|uniref:chitinase n=1 Tax=Peterkaempfera griseoplana TaxID=66896 RepID=UPI0007C7813A|nr:chitinase [Peterkaempfera griseoplana]